MRNICITAEVLSIGQRIDLGSSFGLFVEFSAQVSELSAQGPPTPERPNQAPSEPLLVGNRSSLGAKEEEPEAGGGSLTHSFQPHSFGRCVLGPRRPGPTLARPSIWGRGGSADRSPPCGGQGDAPSLAHLSPWLGASGGTGGQMLHK